VDRLLDEARHAVGHTAKAFYPSRTCRSLVFDLVFGNGGGR
jgi:hypothetical protein